MGELAFVLFLSLLCSSCSFREEEKYWRLHLFIRVTGKHISYSAYSSYTLKIARFKRQPDILVGMLQQH